MYQKVNSSIVSKGAMNSFKEMFPLARMFPLAVMHRGGLSLNVGHHGWPTTKNEKKKKKKKKLAKTINDSKPHIWNYFFENIISGIQGFIFVHTFQWTSSEMFFSFQVF